MVRSYFPSHTMHPPNGGWVRTQQIFSVGLVCVSLAGCDRRPETTGGRTATNGVPKAATATSTPAPVSHGPDWPMFRGNPALTGVTSATLPPTLKLKWTFKTGGPVGSSPAIVGDRVFIGSASSNVFALNLADGHLVWTFTASGPVKASPLVLDGRVYVGDVNTNFYALEATTGQKVWSFGLEDKVESSANWVTTPRGKTILVGGYDYKLYSLDALSGRTNWIFETGNFINGSPAIGNGMTAFGGCDAIIHVVDVVSGKKLKEIEAGAYIAASGALVDGHLYVGHYDNEVLNVDLTAGSVVWRYHDRNFPYFSSPAVTTNRVIFGGRDRRMHCVDRASGKENWIFSTQGKVDSSPVVAGDQVIVGSDDGRVYLVGLEEGKEHWHYEIGQPVRSSAAVVTGYALIGSEDGSVYCFGVRAKP